MDEKKRKRSTHMYMFHTNKHTNPDSTDLAKLPMQLYAIACNFKSCMTKQNNTRYSHQCHIDLWEITLLNFTFWLSRKKEQHLQ